MMYQKDALHDWEKALILGGKTGFLGQALAQILTIQGWEIICPGRNDLDVFDQNAMDAYLDTHRPTHIFNTIGYTQVDTAEEDQTQAALLNKTLPVLLARQARTRDLFSSITVRILSLTAKKHALPD